MYSPCNRTWTSWINQKITFGCHSSHLARGALEAPDVVLLVQRHQGLAVPQEPAAARALVPALRRPVTRDVDPVTVDARLVEARAGAGGAGDVGQGAAHLLLHLRLKQ